MPVPLLMVESRCSTVTIAETVTVKRYNVGITGAVMIPCLKRRLVLLRAPHPTPPRGEGCVK